MVVERLRVLFVNKYAHVTGGADRHCLQLIEELRRRGHEAALLSTASPLNVESAGAFVPLAVTHATRGDLPWRARARVATSALWNRTAAAATARLVREWRPDVVHGHKLYPQLSVAPVAVAARRGIPVVQTLHDYEFISADPFEHRSRRVDRTTTGADARALNTATYALRRTVHRGAVDRWIAVSEFVGDVHSARGIESTVLPHAAPRVEMTSRARAERSGCVFVGRLTAEKGIRDVVAAARLASTVEFRVYGMGPLAGEVASAAKALPNLTFGGALDAAEVACAFADAAVAVVPSRWEEPAGLTVVEARAAGTPVVAYRAGGLPEYVGAAGVVVEREPALLAAAVERLFADEALWSACAAAATTSARAWTLADYVDALEDVYGQVLP